MNDFIKFVTGTKWKDVNADIFKVEGDQGSNPRALIDQMFEKDGSFGGVGSRSNIINNFLGKTGGIASSYFSFAKFTGLLQSDGYQGHSDAAFQKLSQANVDPMDSVYANKIIGPVNRVQSVKARDAGIEFQQSFNLVCEYVARPIGGVNVKAAMLDILANCMEMASAEAVFWGGGYRFNIRPHMYPFKRGGADGKIMDQLYAGKIFGSNGAIQTAMKGFREFGQNLGNADWSNVTKMLGTFVGDTLGALGSMLQSVASTLFGESSKLAELAGQLGNQDDSNKVKQALSSYKENLNKMWKDQVIQETAMPNISGIKALLTGEPVGNWHMTVGNPLNPIAVVGNLICTKMNVEWGEELGPDDFPLELKVTYTIEHGMARDKAAIQSMFNRGAGKIYKLPDYIRAVSDYETRVDNFTGRTSDSWVPSKYVHVNKTLAMTQNQPGMENAAGGNGYWQTYKVPGGTQLLTSGNAATTFIPKFQPVDSQRALGMVNNSQMFLADQNVRAVYFGNLHTQKLAGS